MVGRKSQQLQVEILRAGLVPDVLEAYPEVTLVGSKVALTYLKSLAQRPFAEQPVKCAASAVAQAVCGVCMLSPFVCRGSPAVEAFAGLGREIPRLV
jgi:hypothetical protein